MATLSVAGQNKLDEVHDYDQGGVDVIVELSCLAQEQGKTSAEEMKQQLGIQIILAAIILPIAAALYAGLAIWVAIMSTHTLEHPPEEPDLKTQGITISVVSIFISISLAIYLIALNVYMLLDLKNELRRFKQIVPLPLYELRGSTGEGC